MTLLPFFVTKLCLNYDYFIIIHLYSYSTAKALEFFDEISERYNIREYVSNF